jgi:hypothetical protein
MATEASMTDKRTRNFFNTIIPSATRCEVYWCGEPDCSHAHVIGYDEVDVPFCEIVISEPMVHRILDAMAHPDGEERRLT